MFYRVSTTLVHGRQRILKALVVALCEINEIRPSPSQSEVNRTYRR